MRVGGYTREVSDPTTPSPGRFSNLRNLARAAVTVPPFLVQHLWRRRRLLDDATHTVIALSERPPEVDLGDDRDRLTSVQSAAEGVGPLVMRSYDVRIRGARSSADELMARLIRRPGDLNDDRIAGFVVDDRPATDLTAGDELVVELPGPWNGPVRVIRADASQLLLQTLDGHMEAGQIRFDVIDASTNVDDGLATHGMTFRIRSWARGGDAVFTFLHLGIRVAKELQSAMWVAMCEGAVRVTGGRREGAITVRTEILRDSTPDDAGAVGSLAGDVYEEIGDR